MLNVSLEILPVEERHFRYRLFEILPGFISWAVLALPFLLALVSVRAVSILMIAYLLLWFVKAVALNIRSLQSWRIMQQHQKIQWRSLTSNLDMADQTLADAPQWHSKNKQRRQESPNGIDPEKVVHAVIVATYNEPKEVLEPTIQSVIDSDYDLKKVMFLLAYEERGGPAVEAQAKGLVEKYGHKFMYAEAIKHPDGLPGEVVGKGGNITYAGRRLTDVVNKKGIDPLHVLVTTLDADNRPHKQYFAGLTYVYAVCHNPKHLSFQPIPMFTNNIWDAPAPMRVVATGNSYWMMVQALRPHMLRNFSSHAQPLAALIDTDYWSARTIVEDGHQYWRSYFRYDGQYEVVPIFLPIYQDAVLANGYRRTLKAQFFQVRRWAWGASDIAYMTNLGFFTKNKIPKLDVWFKFWRLFEGHLSWATSPLILAFGALVPLIFHRSDFLANQLPQIASRIQNVALIGIFVTMYISFKILPPKPARYKRHRTVLMVLQWVLLPITTICYSSFAALNAQTRLMFKRYLGTFDVTEKAVKTAHGTVSSLETEA